MAVLNIWIASFIPKDIQGYTKSLPGGAGKTMIPGPTPLSDCFLSDQRSFLNSPNASSRMRSSVDINITTMALVSQRHHCDNTVEVDCEDGAVECNKSPDSSKLKIRGFTSSVEQCVFSFDGGAGNPCVGAVAPDIDWLVHVAVRRLDSSVTVSVENGSVVEPFPAFEMYASLNGVTKVIFQRSPDSGATPWNLMGPPNKSVSGAAKFSVAV
jgi:hypothetical protein